MTSLHELASNDASSSNYGYNPNFGAGVFFCVMFGLFTVAQFVQMIHTRDWAYGCIFMLGTIGELIGWIGRTLSHNRDSEENPFLIQIVCLIIAPCFFSAAMYYTQGCFAKVVDVRFSVIKPMFYLIIFSLADLASLVVQAVGGAKAASTFSNHTDPADGGYIMLGGIAFQLFATAIFVILELIFLMNAKKESYLLVPGTPLKWTLVVAMLSWLSFWILVRCIYRVVELGMGWTGYVERHEWFFIVFDTVPMFLVCVGATALHPGYLVTGRSAAKYEEDEPKNDDEEASVDEQDEQDAPKEENLIEEKNDEAPKPGTAYKAEDDVYENAQEEVPSYAELEAKASDAAQSTQ